MRLMISMYLECVRCQVRATNGDGRGRWKEA